MAWCAKGRGNRELEGGYLLSDSDSEGEGLVDDDSMNDTDRPLDSELELDPADEELHHEPEEDESPPELDDQPTKRRRVEEPPSGPVNQGCRSTPRAPKTRATLALSAGHTPVIRRNVSSQPKTLNMDSGKKDGDESLSSVLGNITNML